MNLFLGILLTQLLCVNVVVAQRGPIVDKGFEFRDHVAIKITPSEEGQRHFQKLRLSVPGSVTPKKGFKAQFLKADIILRANGDLAEGVIGFRESEVVENGGRDLTVSLTKRFLEHSEARVYYKTGASTWIFLVDLSREHNLKAQQEAGGKGG